MQDFEDFLVELDFYFPDIAELVQNESPLDDLPDWSHPDPLESD